MVEQKIILVLGATGFSGLAFIKEALVHASNPNLTLLIRTPSKLPTEYKDNPRITIVEGQLDDPQTLETAMKGITTVVSFLGAYMSLSATLLHTTTTPIADTFPLLFNAMCTANVKRILALSTPTGLPMPGKDVKPWSWTAMGLFIQLAAPQGNAEMGAIGEAVASQDELDWTVFRVPHLNDGSGELKVEAGYLGGEYKGGMELSRGSMAKWVLGEIEEGKWIREAPVLGNS
ncbi:NAD(P)-binding protein [Tothia fuscella]|uniref:NAD(P)-binding protein n=1 Tax=Tothia fuscella TaxID=1048955 RepID=A0A9P4NUU5_9PEZI|nr:NAD(P)-binding protein [Tothia fuscella]